MSEYDFVFSSSNNRHRNSFTGFIDSFRRDTAPRTTKFNNEDDNEPDEFDVPPPPITSQALLGASAPRGAGFGAQLFPGPTVQGGTHLLSSVLADVVKPEIKNRIYVAVTYRAEPSNMLSLFRSMQYINNHYSSRATGGSSSSSSPPSLITGLVLVGEDVCCIMLEGDPWIYIDMLAVLNQKTAHFMNPSGFVLDARVIRVQNDVRDTFFKKLIYEQLPPITGGGGFDFSMDSKLLQDEVKLGLLFYRRLTELGKYCSVGIEETWTDMFQNLAKKFPQFYVPPEMIQCLAADRKFMPVSLYLQIYMSTSFPYSSAFNGETDDKASGISDLLRARKWHIPIEGLHFGGVNRRATTKKADAAGPTAAAVIEK